MTRSHDREQAASDPRLRVAQLAAFVALVAALVGALGPAERIRTSYSWPPTALPAEQPERLWYTPLPLITHRPEALHATVPCTLPPALPDSARPVNVLATARDPGRAGGLTIVADSGRLTISLGRRVLDRVELSAAASDAGCVYRLRLEAGRWTLAGGPTSIAEAGVIDEMPVVYGVFSAVDLRAGTPPAIEVRTAVHATRVVTRQTVAWIIAALAVVASLVLVSFGRRPRPLGAVRRGLRAARAHAHPVDAIVAATLLCWWVLGPAFFDDGWVIARQGTFAESNGFSAYYNTFGTNSPLSYSLDWAQHWLSDSTTRLLVLRVPPLLCLGAMWSLCRWILVRIEPGPTRRSDLVLWSCGAAFLAGALAWGMTLRTEPVTALLVTAVVACMVTFLERASAGPVALSAAIIPFALTGHPAGIVSLAPVLAAAPSLWRWARASPTVASTIASTGIALIGILVFVGSDLEQRRADTETTAEYGLTTAWRYELVRYTGLADPLWGTPLRRASVALIALAVLAFLVRRRRSGSPLDLPASALAIALILLVATPSKHPWHFGALLGLAALAVAAESARFRSHAASDGWQLRPFLVVAAASVAIAWSWAPRHQWNALDLRTLEWTPAFESFIGLATLSVALPFLVLIVVGVRELVTGRSLRPVPWRVAAWTAPLLALPLVAFTLALLAIDAAKTTSWTLGRQNLGGLTANAGCGLADELNVAVPDSARPLQAVDGPARFSLPAWVPPSPVDGLPRFALGPSARELTTTPWFELQAQPVGLFVSGSPGESRLELEWGRSEGDRVRELGAASVKPGFAVDEGSDVVPWRLVAAHEMPEPPEGADRVRISVRSGATPGVAVAVTAPVTYRIERLAPRLAGRSSTLLLPNIVTYFPCERLPELSRGVVEVPRHVVATRDGAWVLRDRGTSPFVGVLDVVRLVRLPIVDVRDRPGDVLEILAVDERIPGAVKAPPETSTFVS